KPPSVSSIPNRGLVPKCRQVAPTALTLARGVQPRPPANPAASWSSGRVEVSYCHHCHLSCAMTRVSHYCHFGSPKRVFDFDRPPPTARRPRSPGFGRHLGPDHVGPLVVVTGGSRMGTLEVEVGCKRKGLATGWT